MPIYKDRPDIPEPLLKALQSDEYEDGLSIHFESLPETIAGRFKSAISVTTLSRSPRQRILWNRHHQEIEIDPEERFWAILGRTIHSLLEQNHGPDDRVEERKGIVLPVKMADVPPGGIKSVHRIEVYLHGAADLYCMAEGRIEDWKFTKAESMLYNKEDHEAQLNVLAYIWQALGFPVKSLRNTYLFRNWEARNVKEGSLYPTGRIKVKDVELWPKERVEAYLQTRLRAHLANEGKADDELDFCTDAERWMGAPIYKVYKLDADSGEPQKMAKHTASSKLEAEDKITELLDEEWSKTVEKNNKLKKPKPEEELPRSSFITKEIKAKPLRCSYCEVSAYCNQRRAELLTQAQEEDDLSVPV